MTDARAAELRQMLAAWTPGPEISCLDAAEILIDDFVRSALGDLRKLDRVDKDELVRRVSAMLGLQREALRADYEFEKQRAEAAEADRAALIAALELIASCGGTNLSHMERCMINAAREALAKVKHV